MKKKIMAIFGGSFNPPLVSHFELAKQILENNNNVEKIVFVPVSNKYKKIDLIDDNHRYNMLKLMCEDEEKLEVSDIEIKCKKQLYTIETLDIFKKKYGKEFEMYFVMGTDNLKELETWKEPERLLNEYKIIVLGRNADNIDSIIEESILLKKYKDSIIQIKGINRINISSTMIRNKIKSNEDVNEYLPKKILDYIKQNDLYK